MYCYVGSMKQFENCEKIKIRGQFFKKEGGNKMLKDLGNLDV